MNEANLMGNVGADPEIKFAQNGRKYATFSVATSEKWKDKNTGEQKEQTEWHRVTVWHEQIAEVVEKYVKKGSRVFVRGKIEYSEYQKPGDKPDDKRFSTAIVLNGFHAMLRLMDKAPSNRPPDQSEPKRDYQAPPGSSNGNGASRGNGASSQARMPLDDEIPFAPEVR